MMAEADVGSGDDLSLCLRNAFAGTADEPFGSRRLVYSSVAESGGDLAFNFGSPALST